MRKNLDISEDAVEALTIQAIKEKTLQVAENFQNDCHKVVDEILDEKKESYQDGVNVWTFKKLAEFEMRLRYLEGLSALNLI